MIADTIPIEYKYGDEFRILPLSDIHYDGGGKNSTCDVSKLKRDLETNVTDKTMIIGVGDWFGGITTKDIKRYNKELDGAITNAILDESVDGLVNIFKPYKDHIIALGDGNHCTAIIENCGTNLMRRFIEKLNPNIKYMGYSWLLKLAFREPNGRGRSLIIRGHHGWGGGSRTEGADITKFAHDVKFWQAQLFLYGHVHKIKVNPMEEGVMIGDNGWRTIEKKMVVCGTYQKTYSKNTTATYAEKRGYPPASITTPLITVTPARDNNVKVRITV